MTQSNISIINGIFYGYAYFTNTSNIDLQHVRISTPNEPLRGKLLAINDTDKRKL